MSKEAVFTMKLETALRDQFMAEARTLDRPASQVMRDLMREFLRRQQEEHDYRAFVHGKAEAAREDRQGVVVNCSVPRQLVWPTSRAWASPA
ncbi:hypothetical protein GALL_344010 [mine drainage metagenome]|uniref:Antitoxin of toxin-antitoxin stability system n=1 Tax=mine drainage metagenome TaxID=410659 RepID=A0A1J5QVA1_9ZZZZ